MPRPLVATINIAAMQHNLTVARSLSPHAKIWAVVKANAYGHGLERAMRGFAAADGLGLIELDGAVRLRELGWTKPISLFEGFFEPSDLDTIVNYQLEFAVHCVEQIEMLESARISSFIDVHLKMNTGMNRLGFTPQAYQAAYTRLRAIRAVRNITCMTHFANADDADNPAMPMAEQVRQFEQGRLGLPCKISLSNSAAILLKPDLHTDCVRPGIMLYGASPGGKSAAQFGLRPAMTLCSKIIGVQHIERGDAVGYGSRFIAEKAMTIGVVACGYADGYPRHAPDGTPVLVDGLPSRLIGRVSMDMIAVDLSNMPQTQVGTPVTLWGDGLPIDEVAHAAGTIGYELMCALAQRVRVVE